MTAEQNNANWKEATHGPYAADPSAKNIAEENRTTSAQETNDKQAAINLIIQTPEGRYEEKLTVYNSNNQSAGQR